MKRIFISSTCKDLKEYRDAVADKIERLKQGSSRMETFGSRSGGAVKASLEEVREADIFVGIIAHRYGTVPAGEEKSITEQEYDEAVRRKIPRLMYLVDPDYDWPEERIEEDNLAQERLEKFKAYIVDKEVVTYFKTPDELAGNVAIDVIIRLKTLKQRQRLVTFAIVGVLIIAIGISALFIRSGQEKAALSGADRQATNQAIADANKTATANNLPSPTATPLEGDPAKEGEIVIVVAEFESVEGFTQQAATLMTDTFEEAAQEYDNVRVILIDHTIESREEARDDADTYGATMVVYGELVVIGDDVTRVQTHYEIVHSFSEVQETFGEGIVASIADIDNMLLFLDQGQDGAYILDFTMGLLAYFQGDFEKALSPFLSAAENLDNERADDLEAASLYFYMGFIYERFDEELAIANYTQSIDFDQSSARSYNNRGVMYMITGHEDLAFSDFNDAIEQDENLAVAYLNRGVIHFNRKDYDLALADYNWALTLTPTDPDIYINRGNVHYAMNNVDLALEDFTTAINLNPTHFTAYLNRGRLHGILGESNRMLDDLREANKLDPNDPDPYWGIGNGNYDLGRYQEAINAYRMYESLTGQLEPFMVGRITEMEALLTPTAPTSD